MNKGELSDVCIGVSAIQGQRCGYKKMFYSTLRQMHVRVSVLIMQGNRRKDVNRMSDDGLGDTLVEKKSSSFFFFEGFSR